LKETLIKEFGQDIAFHEQRQKNASELVYDMRGTSSYLEAAISSLGVTDNQLVKNVAGQVMSYKRRSFRSLSSSNSCKYGGEGTVFVLMI